MEKEAILFLYFGPRIIGTIFAFINALHSDDLGNGFRIPFFTGMAYSVLWPIFALIFLFQGIINAFKNSFQ